jgi:ABC-type dipeptide/oligopeptide/nickel transport system permease subunit
MLLVEHVMALPGLGRLGIEALKRRDFPLLQGFMLWGGLLYLVLGLVLEVGAGFVKRMAVEAQRYNVSLASPQSIRLELYGGMWGLLVLLALTVCTAHLLPYDPTEIHRYDQLLRPGSRYVLGTDFLGRDVLSRTLQGFRSALPRVLLLTLLTGGVAGSVYWLARWLPETLRLPGASILALFDALPPFLLAFMVFLVVEHRPRPLETTLALACLPIAGQLMAYRASLPLQYTKLSYLTAHLLLLELTFFFLNLSPESLTPTWGSDIRLGMHYNHINVWLVIAPALAFTWSRYIFYHLGMYAALRTTYDVQEVALA